jgi:hypothetical protein
MGTKQISRFRIALIGGLIVFVLVVLCGAYLLRPAIRAHHLFSKLETLQLGHSTFGDAEQIAREIGAKPSDRCDQSECTWKKRVDNSQLPRWWRGAGEVFAVDFTVKDSIVMRKNTGFGIEGAGIDAFSPSSVSFEEQQHWGRGNTREPVQAGWYSTELFRYYWFTVRMTPKASPEDRRRYTAFNYGCLWKYKGCKDARDLLPTADPMPN